MAAERAKLMVEMWHIAKTGGGWNQVEATASAQGLWYDVKTMGEDWRNQKSIALAEGRLTDYGDDEIIDRSDYAIVTWDMNEEYHYRVHLFGKDIDGNTLKMEFRTVVSDVRMTRAQIESAAWLMVGETGYGGGLTVSRVVADTAYKRAD